MSQHSQAKDLDVLDRDDEIPKEVSRRQTLNHPGSTSVPKDPLLTIHALALLVRVHDPERQEVDHTALHERDYVHIPVQPLAVIQSIVPDGKQLSRDPRCEVQLSGRVAHIGKDHLVDVERQSDEAGVVCEWLDKLRQGGT